MEPHQLANSIHRNSTVCITHEVVTEPAVRENHDGGSNPQGENSSDGGGWALVPPLCPIPRDGDRNQGGEKGMSSGPEERHKDGQKEGGSGRREVDQIDGVSKPAEEEQRHTGRRQQLPEDIRDLADHRYLDWQYGREQTEEHRDGAHDKDRYGVHRRRGTPSLQSDFLRERPAVVGVPEGCEEQGGPCQQEQDV